MIFHTIHKILGKKDFTTANFLKSFFFLKFRKYSKKNKEKYRQFIFEFRKISITGEGRYKVQPIFERCTLFFRKFTVVPYKDPFSEKFSEPCTL